jgi:hypothetical protein
LNKISSIAMPWVSARGHLRENASNSPAASGSPRARREKPRVSAFTSADIPKILDLEPDLVLTFSDLQADIAAALIRQGVDVHAFNQRTIAEILNSVRSIHLGQYLQDARAVDSHRSVFGPIVFPGCSTSLQPARRSASALHSARASLALWQ